MMEEHYATLGVSPTDTDEAIRRAYLKLALRFHPDKNQHALIRVNDTQNAYIRIKNAYDAICKQRKLLPSWNIQMEIDVSLRQIATGCTLRLPVTRTRVDDARRRLRSETVILPIRVQPGAINGTRIVARGEGHQLAPSAEPGDVIIVLRDKPNRDLRRAGPEPDQQHHLHYTARISLRKYLRGGVIRFPNLAADAPDPWQWRWLAPQVLRQGFLVLPSGGLPILGESDAARRGDLIVHFHVRTGGLIHRLARMLSKRKF